MKKIIRNNIHKIILIGGGIVVGTVSAFIPVEFMYFYTCACWTILVSLYWKFDPQEKKEINFYINLKDVDTGKKLTEEELLRIFKEIEHE